MGRKILAVILGYIAMVIVVMGGLTGAYLAMGPDRAFEAGTYDITPLWMIVWGVVSVVAAIAGGFVCVKIGKTKGAVQSLILLVVLLGALNAFAVMKAEAPPPEDQIRLGDTPNLEAMAKAQSPMWVHIANPFIGVIGVMVGATMGCGCRKDQSEQSE